MENKDSNDEIVKKNNQENKKKFEKSMGISFSNRGEQYQNPNIPSEAEKGLQKGTKQEREDTSITLNLKKERFKRELREKIHLEELNGKDRIIPNNMIFIIPSWSRLMGYLNLGKYVGQNVTNVISDPVIFFGSTEASSKPDNNTLYYLFGLGIYYAKFEIDQEVKFSKVNYVLDKKLLTGIVLSDFVYDHLASSKNVILDNDPDVIIAENLIKIPVDLSSKTEGQLTFIKGAIMRSVFIPYKEIFIEMLNLINRLEYYNVDKHGHLLLCAYKENFNKILVSEQNEPSLPHKYLQDTAGIKGISIGAERFLKSTLSHIELQKIDVRVKNLKKIYSDLKFDQAYFYSILEAAASRISHENIPQVSRAVSPLAIKQTLFFSAEDRFNSFIEWPSEFPRNEAKAPKSEPTQVKPEILSDITEERATELLKDADLESYWEPTKEEEQFVLRIEKSEKVEKRPLPKPPSGDNLEEVFLYLKNVVGTDYAMRSVAEAFGIARDALPASFRISNPKYAWEISKIENQYNKRPDNLGLPTKERKELLEKLNKWISIIEEEKIKEQEKIEIEKKQIEAERLEQEKLERERKEQERLAEEKYKLEEERKERERLKKIRLQQEQVKRQRERERIETEKQEKLRKEQQELERLEREKEERLKLEQMELERIRKEQEVFEKEKAKLNQIKAERKRQAKLLKKKKKEEKKRLKQLKKIENKKVKEKEKLEKVSQELKSMDS